MFRYRRVPEAAIDVVVVVARISRCVGVLMVTNVVDLRGEELSVSAFDA